MPFRGAVLAVAVAGTLLLVACGGAPGALHQSGAGVDPAAQTDGAEGLPALPPNEERRPDLYDETGCVVTAPDQAGCGSTAGAADIGEVGEGEGSWRTLSGFIGPRYASVVSGGAPVVLADTVTEAGAGPWSAVGLFRNETIESLTSPAVQAELLDAAGVVIETTVSAPLVPVVRSGEPAPFVLQAETEVAEVADVRLTVLEDVPAAVPEDSAGASESAGRASRDFELTTWWTRGYADPALLDNYLYRDTGEPHASVTFGTATNVGAVPILQPGVVAAWIGSDGRVVWVAESTIVAAADESSDLDSVNEPIVGDDGDVRPAPDLIEQAPTVDPGSATDFLLVIPAGIAPPDLDGAVPALWGFGR